MNKYHIPVLLREVLDLLQIKKNGKYIDATLGGAGHALEIIEKGGIVLGIDWDKDALDFVGKSFKSYVLKSQLILAKGNFSQIKEIAHLNNFTKVDGVLFDLGVSSHQIDEADRGFSFLKNGPLDMRMDRDSGVKAEVLVNLLPKEDLNDIFTKFGQEHKSYTISNAIVRARRVKAIQTTDELTKVIESTYGIKVDISDFRKNEISKRVFQALRIAVNRELENIEKGLPDAIELLKSKARMGVITFHSLEDDIVNKIFENFKKQKMGIIITEKPIMATKEELSLNRRASSAKLRVFEKN